MVDSTLMDEMKTSVRAEKHRQAAKNFYSKKIKDNPEFYAAEKERIKAYKKNRYNNDPEFAALLKQRAKDAYQKRKAKLAVNIVETQ